MSNLATFRRCRGDAIRRLALRVGVVVLLLSFAVFPRSAGWQYATATASTAAEWLRHRAVVVLGGTPMTKSATSESDLDKLTPINGFPSREVRCLALAMYHEAGNDRPEAQLAVAQVALNRAAAFKRPKAICGTIYTGLNTAQGCLFDASCRNVGSTPTQTKALSATLALAVEFVAGRAKPKAAFEKVTHFHDMKVSPPVWTKGMFRIGRLGRLDFYAPEAPRDEPEEAATSGILASTATMLPPQRPRHIPPRSRRASPQPQTNGNRATGSSGSLASQVFGQ